MVVRSVLCVVCLTVLVPALAGQALLLSHWSFDDPAGTGVVESVQGITETVVGADVRVPGPIGSALTFDGTTTNFTSVVNQASWNFLTSFTITCWIRPAATQTTWVPIIDQHIAAQSMGQFCGLSSASAAHIAVGNASQWQSLYGPSLAANTWTHAAFVFDAAAINGELTLYLDGVLVLTTNIPGGPMLDPRGIVPMRMGARNGGGGFLAADLDDLAFFDGPLSVLAIVDIMNNGVLSGTPQYQTNSGLGSLDVNGVQGTTQSPAIVNVPIGTTATLGLGSTNAGMLWDLGSGLAPLISVSAGAFVLPDGQIVNLDVSDPTLSFWFNLLQGPTWIPWGALSIPFSVPVPAAVSMQMVVVSPTLPSGVVLSQPVRLIVQ
ncbi:MAG: hypothetical protein CMJ83_04815 [Planctomycetes bacterium]|nr:hypothetical protein [Planctomycetota bacterium]